MADRSERTYRNGARVAARSQEVACPRRFGGVDQFDRTNNVYAAEWELGCDSDPIHGDEVEPLLRKALAAIGLDRSNMPGVSFVADDVETEIDFELGGYCDENGDVHFFWDNVSEWVVLHELAHALTLGDGHGPLFCYVLSELVTAVTSRGEGERLLEAFERHNVAVAGPDEWRSCLLDEVNQ